MHPTQIAGHLAHHISSHAKLVQKQEECRRQMVLTEARILAVGALLGYESIEEINKAIEANQNGLRDILTSVQKNGEAELSLPRPSADESARAPARP